VRVAVTGDQIAPFVIATHHIPPRNIGNYVVDMILDTIYMKRPRSLLTVQSPPRVLMPNASS